jgi:hypothetical protein
MVQMVSAISSAGTLDRMYWPSTHIMLAVYSAYMESVALTALFRELSVGRPFLGTKAKQDDCV